MAQIKVAHVARWLEVGGTEQVIFDLCRLGSGQQWVVACQDGPQRPVYEKHGIRVCLAERAASLARQVPDADVINVHWNVNWVERCPDFYAALRAAGVPLVFTVHGLNVLPALPGLIICTSQRVHDLQENNLDRRILITNGVDTARFSPRPRRAGKRVSIIRVCRPVRCAEYFWPAIGAVLHECPKTDLVTVGGPAFTVGRTRALGDRFDVPELLAGADIFAYAPFPNEGTRDLVVLEAMASGLACVLSDVPCVRESVEHGVTGLLTPFGDPQAFAAAVIRLVREPQLRQVLGERAAQVARERLDMRPKVAAYEAAYGRALDQGGPPGAQRLLKGQPEAPVPLARTTSLVT
jgi:glycosyltransferase involved in cell wall biosynthesis